jgi:hypothetical protein
MAPSGIGEVFNVGLNRARFHCWSTIRVYIDVSLNRSIKYRAYGLF